MAWTTLKGQNGTDKMMRAMLYGQSDTDKINNIGQNGTDTIGNTKWYAQNYTDNLV